MGAFRMSLDIVVPTVRANASSVRRVAELSVPPAFASLRILIVVDGPQSEEAWLDLRRLEAQHASIELLSTRPGPHGWPAGASAARNVGIEASAADWVLFLDDDTAPQPDLRSRKDWGADESWRDGRPVLCRTIQQVHVHHTASGNDYSRQDVPALIRSFYRYHTRSLGWSDIGYNFLVDRFGRTWVGRAGGPSRPVRGAHTLGFNHTSVGVAVIGNYDSGAAVDRIVTAIVRLAAWKLDRYGRRPRGRTRVYSHGSDKYPKGWVKLKVIDGHRDTNDTACPGDRLYARLPEIRKRTHWHVKRWS